jgi:alginate O-acetyltransferase complex protein AlgI
MFNLVCIGWILFRAKGTDIVPLLSSLAALPSIDPGTATGKLSALLAILGLPLIATELFAYRRAVEFVDLYGRMPWWMRSALYVAIFYLILFFAAREQNEFIYFQF